jgi:hypothetical protein
MGGRWKLDLEEQGYGYNLRKELLTTGMLSATASLGWLYLWDVEDSINHIDPFVYADDVNIQVSTSVCETNDRLVRCWLPE